ncbi:nexilin-like [Nerophis ophidion]|uniref:nexilin-like n=1 Tax=Nerophis ophidion TaxID=159077 RepID=UPI002ADFF3C2|nr:nexilin-like [Nerophis ophidion]XP_061739075.1 nexilin-like [Nerophis ophidion]
MAEVEAAVLAEKEAEVNGVGRGHRDVAEKEAEVNGVGRGEPDKVCGEKSKRRKAAKSQQEEDERADTDLQDNISDLMLKKEKLLRSKKPVARSYVPSLNKEKGDVTNKFASMQKAREERSRQRSREQQQKRKDQYVKEREWSRRKQQMKELLASSDEEEDVKTKVEKSYVPKITGSVKGKFAEMEKQRQEGEKKKMEGERKRREAQDNMEKDKITRELAKKAAEEGDDTFLVKVVPMKSSRAPGKIKVNFEDMEKSREEELQKAAEDEKKRRYDENKRSFREAKRRSIVPEEDQDKPAERTQATPGKLKMTFEELERERQEQRKKKGEEEAKRRLQQEKKAFEEARLGLDQDQDQEDSLQSHAQDDKEEFRPGKLRLSFEEVERQRVEEERKKAEEEARRRMEEERRAFAEARKSMLVDEDDEVLMALLNLEGSEPGKICASFEDLERQRREEEQKKAEEEAKKRLEEEKKLFAEARKSMVRQDSNH